MATTDAIGATSTGIVELLVQEYDADRFGGREAEISLDRQSMSFGVSLILWHVETSAAHRQAPPLRAPGGGLGAPPDLALDLHYVMMAWAPEAVDEQRLLGWAMRVLHDRPVLSSSLLNSRLPGTFGPSETAFLTPERLLSDRAWQHVMGAAHARPSVGFVVRGVMVQTT